MISWMRKGNTAVITGSGSGIGAATAHCCLAKGMNVVIADRDSDALEATADRFQSEFGRHRCLAMSCDVTDPGQLADLRDMTAERFGAVHCLMNNAGIILPGTPPWEDTAAMRTLVEVNLWGIINGCAAFIPSMLEHGETAVVINTGSKQGITRPPGNVAYNIAKAGVLAYTESLAHDFRNRDECALTAHLLVPGFVYTGMIQRFLPEKPPGAVTPEEMVDFMIAALDEGDFYIICPDNETSRAMDEKRMQWTADDLIKNRPALSRWHPDFADELAAFMQSDD